MDTPKIDIKVQPKLAELLAKTLQVKVKALDKLDGNEDESISLHDILHKEGAFRDRIIQAKRPESGEIIYFIDNGDKKIGKGDLFLHADGFYGVNTSKGKQPAFRFARLFEKALRTKRSSRAARNRSALPPEVQAIKAFAESNRGKNYYAMRSKLRMPSWVAKPPTRIGILDPL